MFSSVPEIAIPVSEDEKGTATAGDGAFHPIVTGTAKL